MNGLLERPDTVIPTTEDKELAATASRAISRFGAQESLRVRVDENVELELPKAVTRLLAHLLTEMSQGNAVTIIPIHAELTTQQAADYLNVSRPYLIGLLKEEKIPFHKVGTHRRVKFFDLQQYRDMIEERRNALLDELAEQSQKLGLGY